MSHSPIPWHAERHNANDTARDPDTGYWSVEAHILNRTGVVADTLNRDCTIDPEEDADNAQFIVRACNSHGDLLAALKLLTAKYDKPDGSRNAGDAQAIDIARAAIAKATGEQP